jgi:hypothetical protein
MHISFRRSDGAGQEQRQQSALGAASTAVEMTLQAAAWTSCPAGHGAFAEQHTKLPWGVPELD